VTPVDVGDVRVAPYTHPENIDLDDLAQVVGEPITGEVLVCSDQLGPASGDDATEQIVERQMCVPRLVWGSSLSSAPSEIWPVEWPDSKRIIGRICMTENRPAPECRFTHLEDGRSP
jgi:hypothetical protein